MGTLTLTLTLAQASVVAPAIFPPGAAGLEAFGNTYCGGRDDYNKFSGA